MPNKRDLKLNRYGISKYAYREMANFCLQYREKKAMIAAGRGEGFPRRDVELIERTAKEAGGTLAPVLLKNVTDGIAYEKMPVPCGRRQFYDMRQNFFALLYDYKSRAC